MHFANERYPFPCCLIHAPFQIAWVPHSKLCFLILISPNGVCLDPRITENEETTLNFFSPPSENPTVFLRAFVVHSILAPSRILRENLLKKSHWVFLFWGFLGGCCSILRKHLKSTLNLKCVLSCVQLLTFCENLDLISFSCILKSCDTFIFCFLDRSLATFVEKLKGGKVFS